MIMCLPTFSKYVLHDKDENLLTELNRELLLLFSKRKINQLSFICSDINSTEVLYLLLKSPTVMVSERF